MSQKLTKVHILIFIFFIFGIFNTIAETNDLFMNEKLTGFYGINFGATKEDVINNIKAKGFYYKTATDYNFGDYVEFTAGTFAMRKLKNSEYIRFYFYDQKFYLANLRVNLQNNQLKETKWLESLITAYMIKYDLHFFNTHTNEKNIVSNSYFSNGNQLSLTYLDKTFETTPFILSVCDFSTYLTREKEEKIRRKQILINSGDI